MEIVCGILYLFFFEQTCRWEHRQLYLVYFQLYVLFKMIMMLLCRAILSVHYFPRICLFQALGETFQLDLLEGNKIEYYGPQGSSYRNHHHLHRGVDKGFSNFQPTDIKYKFQSCKNWKIIIVSRFVRFRKSIKMKTSRIQALSSQQACQKIGVDSESHNLIKGKKLRAKFMRETKL